MFLSLFNFIFKFWISLSLHQFYVCEALVGPTCWVWLRWTPEPELICEMCILVQACESLGGWKVGSIRKTHLARPWRRLCRMWLKVGGREEGRVGHGRILEVGRNISRGG